MWIIQIIDLITDLTWTSDVVLNFQTMEAKLWTLPTRLLMLLSFTHTLTHLLYTIIHALVISTKLFLCGSQCPRSHLWSSSFKYFYKHWSEWKKKTLPHCHHVLQQLWGTVSCQTLLKGSAWHCSPCGLHMLPNAMLNSNKEYPQAHRQGQNHNQEIIIIHSNHKWGRVKWLKLNSGLLPLTAGMFQ